MELCGRLASTTSLLRAPGRALPSAAQNNKLFHSCFSIPRRGTRGHGKQEAAAAAGLHRLNNGTSPGACPRTAGRAGCRHRHPGMPAWGCLAVCGLSCRGWREVKVPGGLSPQEPPHPSLLIAQEQRDWLDFVLFFILPGIFLIRIKAVIGSRGILKTWLLARQE